MEHHWSMIGTIFALRSKQTNLGNAVLRGDVLSQNAEILAITKEVSAVNDDELREADRRIAEVLAQFRLRLLMVATIAFSIGLILAGTTVMYAVPE
jgi:hypothetical protein